MLVGTLKISLDRQFFWFAKKFIRVSCHVAMNSE